jgi:hypothetical protein
MRMPHTVICGLPCSKEFPIYLVNGTILLTVKLNLSQQLLIRINLMFWWSSAEISYSCPKTLNKSVQSRENVHILHMRRTSHSRELAGSQQRFSIMNLI